MPVAVILPDLLAKTGRFVTCLAQDSAGRLWIGAEEGGFTCIADGRTQTLGLKDGFTDDSPFGCVADGKGGLWLGNRSHGLSHFDGTSWQHFGVLHGLGGTRVYDLAMAPDSAVWCATENGVSRFDGQTWQRFSAADGLPPGGIAAVAADSAGHIWAGGAAGGLAIFADGNWQQRPADQPLRDEFINDLLVAKDGTLWVATNSGLFRSNTETNLWGKITPAAVLKSWTENVITCLAETPTGTILCGTRKYGILLIDQGADPATVSVRAAPVCLPNGANSAAATFVRALLPLAAGTILAGTYGAGPVLVTLPVNTAATVAQVERVSGCCPEPHRGVSDSPNPSRQDSSVPTSPSSLGSNRVAETASRETRVESATGIESAKTPAAAMGTAPSLARTEPTASTPTKELDIVPVAVGPVRANRNEGSGESKTPRPGVAGVEHPRSRLPVLARARVREFAGGVYKQFYVKGGETYTVRIVRSGSHNVVLSGVFLDSLPREPFVATMRKMDEEPAPAGPWNTLLQKLQMAIADLANVRSDSPVEFCRQVGEIAAASASEYARLCSDMAKPQAPPPPELLPVATALSDLLRLAGYSRDGQQVLSRASAILAAYSQAYPEWRTTAWPALETFVLNRWDRRNAPAFAGFRAAGWEPCPAELALVEAWIGGIDRNDAASAGRLTARFSGSQKLLPVAQRLQRRVELAVQKPN